MTKKLLFILAFFTYLNIYSSQVSGKVYLDNSSNFENIKISFSPVSPSAVSNEVYSKVDGSFTAELANGIYNITYSIDQYQTFQISNVFISTDFVLDDVNLSSNLIIEISGNVEGNWTKKNTYKIVGNTTVSFDKILTIEEGTEIKFDGKYSLIVDGKLIANGKENSYIKFSSFKNPPARSDWNQIVVNGSIGSIFNYCIIEYGKENYDWNGMIQIKGKADITNSIIRETDGTSIGTSTNQNVTLSKNEIYNADWGIIVAGSGMFNIYNNKFENTRLGGILDRSDTKNTIIKNNILGNCGQECIGTFGTNTSIEKNIIYNSYYGIYSGQYSPNIINNTIINNVFGIYLNDNEIANTSPKINSNIIAHNSNFAIYSEGKPKPSQVIYNLFYGNSLIGNNNLPVGAGTIITVNKNGTPADAYFNLFSNPEFSSILPSDISFCALNSSSVAINAGDPDRNKDTDGSVIDIGAISYGQTLSVVDNNYKNISLIVYPNPMENFLNFESSIQLKEISIFNTIGTKIYSIDFSNEQFTYKWDLPISLANGLYIYILKDINNGIFTGKILKK